LGTDADQWIKAHKRSQDGCAAWIALCEHYDGPAEGDKRVTVARSDITLVHYKNESSFSFEKYSTRLRKAFTTLQDYGQPKCEREKVEILLNQINTNDQRLISSIAICRDSHANTYDEACTYLSSQIVSIFPQHQPNAFGKGGRGGKKSKVRNISAVKKGRGGKTMCNGVDISDTTRYFSKEEFSKLGDEGRKHLNNCPKRKASKEARGKKKKQKSVEGGGGDEHQRQVAAIINGVMQASRHENSGASVPGQITLPPMPQHGPHARPRSVAQVSAPPSTQSVVTYDHTGNIV
jgi:hypothetical protein